MAWYIDQEGGLQFVPDGEATDPAWTVIAAPTVTVERLAWSEELRRRSMPGMLSAVLSSLTLRRGS